MPCSVQLAPLAITMPGVPMHGHAGVMRYKLSSCIALCGLAEVMHAAIWK